MKKLLYFGLSLSLLILSFSSCKDDEKEVETVLSGTVLNSQTGLGMPNALVCITSNLYATSPVGSEYTITTDAMGNYSINGIPAGTYIGFVVANGYFTQTMLPFAVGEGEQTVVNNPVTIVETPAAGAIRIVLTWGQSPFDLDSHLTGPNGSTNSYEENFHIYFANDYSQNANLDVDDIWSFGPETITIEQLLPGRYRYSVNNYEDQSENGYAGIISSPAKVEVYSHTEKIASYTPPVAPAGTSANTWRVFDINVDAAGNYLITPVNTYIYANSIFETDVFRSTKKKLLKFNTTDF